MSLMAANEESDPSAILNGFWVTLFLIIVLSPAFYLADKKLPPEGANTLNLVAIIARHQTYAIASTKRQDLQLFANHYPLTKPAAIA